MIAANGFKECAQQYFFTERFDLGAEAARRCLQQQPQQSQHFVRKALYQVQANNIPAAYADLKLAIVNDQLNHYAYYNWAILQIREDDFEGAFKNLCCCLSVGHLLQAERSESMEEVDASIDYCFNNKEARMLKSILKLRAGKNIEALNQINYALYLAPSHPHLKILQDTVYRAVGMKELKPKSTPFQKPKYDRLETNKQVPSPNKIKAEIDKLLKQYNRIIKSFDNKNIYKVTFTASNLKKDIIQTENIKEKVALKLAIPLSATAQPELQQSACISCKEKDSTANNSQHIQLAKEESFKSTGMELLEKPQPFFLLDSSLSNLSISNISQNSHVKMNKMQGIEFSEENILDSSACSQGEVKLPLRLSQLKAGEKIVVTLQRTALNEHGQSERIQELYEVVGGQLVKINK